VVSDTLVEADLEWRPTTVVPVAEMVPTVADLRTRSGGDIYVYGSLTLVRALLAARLVDELLLLIEPVTLGGGKTLFPDDGEVRPFELVSAVPSPTGVQICRYRPV
jgi:dihydrofolate reductase